MVDMDVGRQREELLALILDIFNYSGNVAEVSSKSLIDIGVDSLELVELSTELEERFEMMIDMDRLESSTTISELLDLIVPSTGR